MSTNLYYESNTEKERYLGKDLKYILAPILWEHDGTLHGDSILINMSTSFWDEEYKKEVKLRDFLFGISKKSDESGKEAKKLLNLLNKYEDGIFISLKG